jgi:trehalose 6-phosphate synthase/phosphatase
MHKLIIVSNRLPVTAQKRGSELSLFHSVGGLATGLGSIYAERESLWLGWPGITSKNLSPGEREVVRSLLRDRQCEPVFLSQYEFEQYYNDFCNRSIWPLFHYFPHYAHYNPSAWNVYTKVNKKFCDAVCAVAKPQDVIWVHDYHLMLLPGMLREKLPDATIGFFLHIPFPQYELFRLIPWRKELLSGLIGADLIGFHTFEYTMYFLNCVRRILGYEQEMTRVKAEDRIVKVDTFPMGIDFRRFSTSTSDPLVKKEISQIQHVVTTERIILSIDRLDYTKGVPFRLKAFDLMLDEHPELKEHVTFILVAVPSRTKIDQYVSLRHEVDQLVGMINGKHGTMGWTPVQYLFKFLPFQRLVALFSLADIAMVTPLRDGMNLMAKEYLATKGKKTGMLVLSEFAGAAQELGEAIIVNPNNIPEVSAALYSGLTMPEEEKKKRVQPMQERLSRYDLRRWTSDFLDMLDETKGFQRVLAARFMDQRAFQRLYSDYRSASSRIMFLDYDGSIVPLAKTPEQAPPDKEILEILEAISKDPRNTVIVISGRDRQPLERWFGSLPIGLIAEHGLWIRRCGEEWEMTRQVSDEWKEEIRPILERYVDRTPETFVEEKEYSLAWHFRKADPDLTRIRSIELREDLMLRTKNLHLALLEGDKVVEIKNADITKGVAVHRWLTKGTYDFILAIGDDRTDEDLFAAIPKEGYTMKVGPDPSRARFSIRSVEEVRTLLRRCVSESGDISQEARDEQGPRGL